MAVLCYFSSMVLLALIAVQDFKERMVYWFLFPMAGIAAGAYAQLQYLNSGRNILVNFSYVSFSILIVTAYLYIKNNKIEEVFKRYLGIGDVLFFAVIAVTLPSMVFAFFFVFSLLLTLVLGLTFFRGNTIPLAGCQSILLGGLLSLFHFNIISALDIEKLIML